jgi:anti-sigma B factor antagonist
MTTPVVLPAEEVLRLTVTAGRGSRVTAVGEVDAVTAERLAAAIGSALTGETSEITVDLTGVDFLDAAGVHALAAGRLQANAAGSRMTVVASHHAVLHPLRIAGLLTMLQGTAATGGRAA